jgi:hypothetical protein
MLAIPADTGMATKQAKLGSETALSFVNIGDQPHLTSLPRQVHPYWSEMEKKACH